MGPMKVIVMKVAGKKACTLIRGVVGAGIGPLPGDGLDEALSLAVGLRAVRFGKRVFEPQFLAGCRKEPGAVGAAAIGEHTLYLDAMLGIEAERLMQSSENAGRFLIGQKAGKGQSAVIINGDMETFHSGSRIAVSAIPGGTDAGLLEAPQLLN